MGRDIQWREAVVRLLVAARPMQIAARAVSGESALHAWSRWGAGAWCDDDAQGALAREGSAASSVSGAPSPRQGGATSHERRPAALERVVPISLVGHRPMGVRTSVGANPIARRPRETATWRERWPDVPAARGTRGATAR